MSQIPSNVSPTPTIGTAVNPKRRGHVASSIPTEEQVVHAMKEWDEGAAYRKVRHAANVGACYSNATICLAGETFCNQQLVDDLVANRLELGEFTAVELNPASPGTLSICEFVSVPMLNRLLEGMQGTFTADEAWRFMRCHTSDSDNETMRLVADKTHFTAAEREDFYAYHEVYEPELVSTDEAIACEEPKKTHGCLTVLKVVGIVLLVLLYVVLFFVTPTFVLLAAGMLVFVFLLKRGLDRQEKGNTYSYDTKSERDPNESEFIGPFTGIMMIADSIKQSELEKKRNARDIVHEPDYPYDYEDSNEKFPDYRSVFQRRAWAEDHDWDADGGNEHNYDADG